MLSAAKNLINSRLSQIKASLPRPSSGGLSGPSCLLGGLGGGNLVPLPPDPRLEPLSEPLGLESLFSDTVKIESSGKSISADDEFMARVFVPKDLCCGGIGSLRGCICLLPLD